VKRHARPLALGILAGRWDRRFTEGSDQAESRKVDADRLQAGVGQSGQRRFDHVPTRCHDDNVDLRRSVPARGRAAHDAVVEDRLLERHRDLLLGL
jgi:hypothetical protein